MPRRTWLFLVIALVAACSGDADDGSAPAATTSPPTTAEAPAPTTTAAPPATTVPTTTTTTTEPPGPAAISLPDDLLAASQFGARGPYPVGVRTLEGEPAVEVWYPAVGDAETVEYSLAEFLPEIVVTLLGDQVPVQLTLGVSRDLPADTTGVYPVAVYSHGFGGFRTISADLMSHLASWGVVAVAPDHSWRGIGAVATASVGEGDDVAELVDAVERLRASDLAPVAGDGVVAVGHSAGARAAATAIEPLGAAGWVGLAPGSAPDCTGPLDCLIMIAGDDRIIEAETGAAAVEAAGPARVAVLPEAGHNVFTDLCFIGDRPLPEIAADIGLPVTDQLALLATDGCLPEQLPPSQAGPAIGHLVTAQVRAALEVGDPAAPFADEVVGTYVAELGMELSGTDD